MAHAQARREARQHAKGHTHSHTHGRATRSRRRLTAVLLLTALYMFAEAAGGWYTRSLALLADAGHMLADVAALTLALMAVWFGSRPANSRKTFGYYRLEILAALINGVALVCISLYIFYEAYKRWSHPTEVDSGVMVVIAFGGLLVNVVCAWILHGDHKDDMNVRGAWLHIIGDALGSVGAILVGALMYVYGWYAADPVFS